MIPNLIVSLLAVAAFGFGLWRSGIVPVARKTVTTAFSGISAITDSSLDDDAKEAAVRQAAIALLGAAFSIAVRMALVLALAAVPIFLADLVGIASSDAVMSLMARLDYIVIVSIVAIVLGEGLRRRAKRGASAAAGTSAASNSYSDVERVLHGIAFSSPGLQRRVSRLENRLIGKPAVTAAPPIFVTSLARGGTTALLNALAELPGVSTHTYRDMPFVTAPVLWDRFAGGAKRSVATRERAHGDGLSIDLDSPEAFEEVIWKMHWPEKYVSDGIAPWTRDDRKAEADEFLAEHMAKVIRARRGQDPAPPVRYCSKNNANICRLQYLHDAFPDSEIIIPLRQPARHAESLHRQHMNFLDLQSSDDFVRRYMADIGHFEFGLIHKPMLFPGFDPTSTAPEDPNHWLEYWIAAFQFVEARLEDGQRLTLVGQDSLRQRPQDTMAKLADRLDQPLTDQVFDKTFRSSPDTGDDGVFRSDLLDEAGHIYARLNSLAF
ncbi:MAG: sulfotransferase [Pseudomonadota bacterium]